MTCIPPPNKKETCKKRKRKKSGRVLVCGKLDFKKKMTQKDLRWQILKVGRKTKQKTKQNKKKKKKKKNN